MKNGGLVLSFLELSFSSISSNLSHKRWEIYACYKLQRHKIRCQLCISKLIISANDHCPQALNDQFIDLYSYPVMNAFFQIIYLLCSQNSGIIIPANVTGKYSKCSFRIRRWQRYCLYNLVPFRFSSYMC